MIPGITAGFLRAWSPGNLDPDIWLDDSSQINQSGSSLSYWGDKSSRGYNFIQPSSPSMPSVVDGAINGRRYISFDGLDDRLYSSTPNLMRNAAEGWSFAVYKRKSNVSTAYNCLFSVVSGFGGEGYTRFANLASDNASANKAPWLHTQNQDASGADFFPVTAPPNVLDWGLYSFHRRWSLGEGQIFANGISLVSEGGYLMANSPDVANQYDTMIGSYINGQFADIDIACLVVGSNHLDESGRQKLEGWAALRYGLQGNLPAGHPYKDAPP